MFKKIINIVVSHRKPLVIILSTWGIYFLMLFSRIIHMEPDGLYAGHVNVWSDWALHIGMANIFATKDISEWFAYHPMYANGKFTYGFLTNLISGLLLRIGFPIDISMLFPSIIYALLLIIAIYFLAFQLLKSKKAAILALSFFFLSSGFGFINFIKDFKTNPSINLIFYPPIEYSRDDNYEWYSGNYVVGMLAPQRAFLLGLCVAIWSLNILIYAINKKYNYNVKLLLVVGGIVGGILPITHMHSFISLIILSSFLLIFNLKKWRHFFWYYLPLVWTSAFFYIVFISGGIENPNFMQWFPGWTNKNGFWGWIVMWIHFWGIMLPSVLITLFALFNKMNINLKAFSAGVIFIFLMSNLILLQPIHWDNSKLFLWCYLGFSIIISALILHLWQGKFLTKILAIILIFLLTSTGALELIRLQRIDKNSYRMISNQEMKLAQEIRSNTDPLAIFATVPSHNHPIMMWAARPIIMGYTAWVWNFGFLYQQREEDLKQIFKADANLSYLLKKYKVSYIYIGPSEERDMKPNISYFRENFPIAFSNEDVLVFDVRMISFSK